MKIVRKSQLVELLSGAQVVCLTIALLAGAFLVRASLQRIVRTQIMEDNRLIATQMSKLIRSRHDIDSIEFGNDSWNKLQTLIEEVSLPNDGYMCVASATDGSLICHPKIRANPGLRKANVGKTAITVDGSVSSIGQSALSLTGDGGAVAGVVGAGNATEVVSVAALPQLNSILLVHQSEQGFRKAVNLLLLPLGAISAVLGFGLILTTKKVSVGILSRYENEIAEINEGLERTVESRTQALTKTRDTVIFGLAKLAESRDNDTGEHLERIREYVTILARRVAAFMPLNEGLAEDIGLASSLHDIGKVGVPDQILLKPGRLTPEERKVIETHPLVGQECLEAMEQRLGKDNFLSLATEICAYHHEKWDGTGYPYGLQGTDIPLSARIVALADVYDALRSRRPYKAPMSHAKARSIIVQGRGTHFDPRVVDAFLMGGAEFEAFSNKHAEQPLPQSAEDTPTDSPLDVRKVTAGYE
jgi:HD-GYP domain-containing protein (c-di-GMP phosphodiesterase class II)